MVAIAGLPLIVPQIRAVIARWVCRYRRGIGGVAEWLKAHAWKACIRGTVSWVRIPLPPPHLSHCYRTFFQDAGWIRTCPETSGAYARYAFPSWPDETAQLRPTGSRYRKNLLRWFWWYGQTRVGETASAGMWVGFTRENIPPRAWSTRGRGRAATDSLAQAIPNRARCSSHAIGRRVSPASFFAVSSSGWRSWRMVFTTSGARKLSRRIRVK